MTSIQLFGKDIPLYSLFGATGVILGVLVLFFISKKKKVLFDDLIYVYVYAVIAAMIGAKLLYLIVSLPLIIPFLQKTDMGALEIIKLLLSGGFVFYGGALGAFLGAFLASSYFKLEPKKMINLIVPTLPLIHGFGRLGCHFVGCCYGAQTTGRIFITYHSSDIAPNDVHLLPVQLTEACFEFLLFALLMFLLFKGFLNDKLYKVYFTAYGSFRFIIEFFRGDADRGIFFGLSTSQWISLGLLLYVVISVIYAKRKTAND